jgi:hypothetical protein
MQPIRIACRPLELAFIRVMNLKVALVVLMAALLATPALGETPNAHAAGLQLRQPYPAGRRLAVACRSGGCGA